MEPTLETIDDVLRHVEQDVIREHRFANVELKENWAQDHGKKFSALANKVAPSKPAWLIIGIRDDGAVVGNNETWAKRTEQAVSQHINGYLDPSQACRGISCHATTRGWLVIVLIVNPGAVTQWNQGAYKAAGTTLALMRPDEVVELTLRLPGLTDYSRQPWEGPINAALVRRFAEMVVAHRKNDTSVSGLDGGSTQDILRRMRIAGTNTARILFGDTRCRVVWLSSDGSVLQNNQYNGVLSLVTPEFQERIQEWCQKSAQSPDARHPRQAFREAIANAVAHAAYFDNDGEIMIEVAPHRVTISNVCLRESSFFANKWFSGAHKTVNGLLMETLRQSGVVDELGRGKNIIFRDSIFTGKHPPQVFIDPAGRQNRWRLVMHSGAQNDNHRRLLARLRDAYQDQRRALIAYALVVWSEQPLSAIKQNVDEESLPFFIEVLDDAKSPVFYSEERDTIYLRRWVEVLLDEGKDSKKFSEAEEAVLFWSAYRFHTRHTNSVINNRDLRELAGMGNTRSEVTLASSVLGRWAEKGWIERKKKGEYKFARQHAYESKLAESESSQALARALKSA